MSTGQSLGLDSGPTLCISMLLRFSPSCYYVLFSQFQDKLGISLRPQVGNMKEFCLRWCSRLWQILLNCLKMFVRDGIIQLQSPIPCLKFPQAGSSHPWVSCSILSCSMTVNKSFIMLRLNAAGSRFARLSLDTSRGS